MARASSFNDDYVQRFRATKGEVLGPTGGPMVLLHHTGAKSGIERVTPLTYLPLDGSYAIFATKGGHPTNPDWYYNLLAHPDATIEVGDKTVPVHARITQGGEREGIWTEQKRVSPRFATYEETAGREIPVIVLEPR